MGGFYKEMDLCVWVFLCTLNNFISPLQYQFGTIVPQGEPCCLPLKLWNDIILSFMTFWEFEGLDNMSELKWTEIWFEIQAYTQPRVQNFCTSTPGIGVRAECFRSNGQKLTKENSLPSSLGL